MGNRAARCCFKILKMMRSDQPIVVVMGSTGTGKSKLAIELAKKFNGEILSADSMQVYKGLDIVTNKVTSAELEEVPHHLLGFVHPLHTYTVTDFLSDALPVISRLIEEKKLPIIVGGTHYYIEAILWDMLLTNPEMDASPLNLQKSDATEKSCDDGEKPTPPVAELLKEKISSNSFLDVSDTVLHDCLKEVDPVTASSLHPRNRRKVIRALQVYQQHGQPLSKILAKQRAQSGGSYLGGPLRFPNAILLWVQTDMEVLMKRLDDRVDDMLAHGLVEELVSFHNDYNANRVGLDGPKYEEGIFQSIGFKEFHNFLTLPENERDINIPLFQQSLESMKIATRKYAKKQIKWIKNRFLRRPDRSVPPVYALNSTVLDQWEEAVFKPAAEILESKLKGEQPLHEHQPLLSSLGDNPNESHYCSICDMLLVGSNTITAHNTSKKHWKRVVSAKKFEQKLIQARTNKLEELSGLLETLMLQKLKS